MALSISAQKTPLLDRDLFFGNPEISSGQISPDGQWISFMKAYNGIMNVWVKKSMIHSIKQNHSQIVLGLYTATFGQMTASISCM